MAKKGVTAAEGGAALVALLSNPVVAYGLGGVLILFALWGLAKALPGIVGGLGAGAKAAFDTTEGALTGLGSRLQDAYTGIVVAPGDQNLDERTRTDQVKGLGVEGDRALSDAIDSPLNYLWGLVAGPSN